MSKIHYGPASALSLDAVADLYTRTFADYYYAAHITADLMLMFQRVEQINLDYSPVQYVDDEAVGLATVGLRGTLACCKGFGVVVPFRGRGLAEPLSLEVIRQARLAGATTLQLGVLKHNERAVKTYLATGFKVTRDLVSFEWKKEVTNEFVTTEARENATNEFVTTEFRSDEFIRPVSANAKDVLAEFARFHPVRPSWGHDLPSLREMDGLHALALFGDGRLNGYILYQIDEQGHAQIQDVAAESVAQGAALLRALQPQFARVYRNNDVGDNPILGAYAAAGFHETLKRFEMAMEL